jgi:uncharacterized protein
VSKSGIFHKIKDNKIFRRRLLIAAIVATLVFIPFWYYWEPNYLENLWNKITDKKALFFLALGFRTLWELWMLTSATLYGILLIILASKIKGKKIFAPLASFGQMALSNYLIQSLMLVPYLLITDKIKGIAPTEGLITFIIVIALQLIFSQWWMKKYTMGPFEWVLRSFTYWKWQKIKRSSQHQFDNEKQMITISTPQYL